jgi:DNA-binding CsgD family transcriptional regulator
LPAHDSYAVEVRESLRGICRRGVDVPPGTSCRHRRTRLRGCENLGLLGCEREVVAMVVSGMLNKQIAAQVGSAENTVKVHRSRAMEKMQANSLADLIKMIERLQVPPGNSP